MPDGQLAVTLSYFGGQTRTSLSAQFSPRISGTFRYIGIQDFNDFGFDTYRDRSFDVRFLLAREGRLTPALTIGLQDLAGTGIYAGEYIVPPRHSTGLSAFRAPAGQCRSGLGPAGQFRGYRLTFWRGQAGL